VKLFIDTEFDSYRGALISMAIVAEDGSEFYEVLPHGLCDPWVEEHVIPVLNKRSVGLQSFQHALWKFLAQFPEGVEVVADYPSDIQHFCYVLENGPGQRLLTPPLTMTIDPKLNTRGSKIPHNALEDARALRLLNGAAP
jgi:hypothetical protein